MTHRIALAVVVCAQVAAAASSAPAGALTEAVGIVEQQALFVERGEHLDRARLDTPAKLKAFLASRDFYSDYLSRAQFEQLKQTQKPRYAGIGMEIQKTPDGEVHCYPLPSGPAAAAGIHAGDRLIAIAGEDVQGRSLPDIVGLAGGDVDTRVRVDVENARDGRRSVDIRRAEVEAPAVSRERRGGITIIRVPSFGRNTRSDLEFMLSTLPRAAAVVIDLRSNAGGDFHGSVDAAMLFLDRGAPIVSVRSRRGIARYDSTRPRRVVERPVVVWQDGLSASAAEVFIAALTQNRRATSVGTKSFGKGTRQDVIELAGGGALILTTGMLRTPDDREFDGQGLRADVDVAARADTAAYLRKSVPLLAADRSPRTPRAAS